jgi:S1-C subfamily serine protease
VPWQIFCQEASTGSGCIIAGRRILTNAHVVGDQAFIQVRRSGEAKRYTAEVEIVAHELDLAIVKVNDDSFFSGVRPVRIGGLAEVRDKVAVYGFPKGGDKLSITEGVVSRVEHSRYTHSGINLLTCQIDAAINSGNSGGPVVKDDKIVGVAFQAGSGENIGYMVPAPVIDHFLTDIRDGEYEGTPDLGISCQKMENPDIRLKFGMTEKQTGILVNTIYPDSPAEGTLRSGDIILSIDGENVEDDGTVEFRKGERTSWKYLVQKKYMNDVAKLEILRNNRIMNMVIKLSAPTKCGQLVPHELYDVAPTYYIIGGLVFEPLTLNYLKGWGNKWHEAAPANLINYYFYGQPTDSRKEIVVLIRVLADEINAGYHEQRNRVISYVNGKKIGSIGDLVSAFEEPEDKYHVIEDERGYKIVLDKYKADETRQRILNKYSITSDRSEDLDCLKKKYASERH